MLTELRVTTPRFFLRPLVESDATQRYLEWLADPAAARFINSARDQRELEKLRAYVRTQRGREDVLFLGIFSRADEQHIGNVKFELIPARASAVMGILIGEPAWRGKGVAPEILDACARALHRRLNIVDIVLGVESVNVAAIRAYEKCGFREVPLDDRHPAPQGSINMVRREMGAQRLALGTVQFGLAYGVANAAGAVPADEAGAIVHRAWNAGMTTLQTARAYGESETRLGEIDVSKWQVVSKLPALPRQCEDAGRWLDETLSKSLRELRIERLYALMLHRSQDLGEENGEELYAALERAKADGRIGKIGISIYDPEELDATIPKFGIELVQAPFNVFDRRLEATGWLDRLREKNVETHVRSAFLQGLLLLRTEDRPSYFARWVTQLSKWDAWVAESGITPFEAALRFLFSREQIDRVVVGVDNLAQLDALLATSLEPMDAPASLASDDGGLINPVNWPQR